MLKKQEFLFPSLPLAEEREDDPPAAEMSGWVNYTRGISANALAVSTQPIAKSCHLIA